MKLEYYRYVPILKSLETKPCGKKLINYEIVAAGSDEFQHYTGYSKSYFYDIAKDNIKLFLENHYGYVRLTSKYGRVTFNNRVKFIKDLLKEGLYAIKTSYQCEKYYR